MGWLTMPFQIIFEGLGPAIEVFGYTATLFCYVFGYLSTEAFVSFLLLAMGVGLLLSFASLLLEEMAFHTYYRKKDLYILFAAAVFENFGYRQLTAVWRLEGLIQWIFHIKTQRGEMTRTSSWQIEQTKTSTNPRISSPATNLKVETEENKKEITL
jgi:hypothetical protein